MVKKNVDETFEKKNEKISWSNFDLYEIDDKKKCWRSFIRRINWSNIDLYEPMIEKNAGGALSIRISCWFWMHIKLFSLVAFHLLCWFFFYSYFLIFFKFRRGHYFLRNRWWSTCYKNDDEAKNLPYQSYSEISVWWFRYDRFQSIEKKKKRSQTMKYKS